jgi:hypothetical protein
MIDSIIKNDHHHVHEWNVVSYVMFCDVISVPLNSFVRMYTMPLKQWHIMIQRTYVHL